MLYRRSTSPPTDLPFEVQTSEGKYRAAIDERGMVFKTALKFGPDEFASERVLQEGRLAE